MTECDPTGRVQGPRLATFRVIGSVSYLNCSEEAAECVGGFGCVCMNGGQFYACRIVDWEGESNQRMRGL